MKLREKNPLLRKEIESLNKAGVEKPIWKAVAKGLNRPRSRRYEVDLSRLERFAEENDTIVVPGIVLGDGQIKKRLTVAAVRFSAEARKKIEKAGGKCLAIEDVSGEEPSKIRIMG
ncbi:MAG TPA: 50S ribosomal protein L18e [archaeon]|jgi:large subunit ribosomal protein L18e|nr:50S ribosomal protein L18e [archaeon]